MNSQEPQNTNNEEPKEEPRRDDDSSTGFPKFNYYWIYGLLAIFLMANLYVMGASRSKNIPWVVLSSYIKHKDVQKVDVINEEVAEVYIKKEALTRDSAYKSIKKTNFNYENIGPHFTYNIGNVEGFERRLREAQDSLAQADRLSPEYKTRPNWIAPIMQWVLPLLLLAGVWMFIMRRMGGGAGGAGSQLFNIGRSRATLFDSKDSKVNITFQDVAGLDEAKVEVMEVVDFLRNPKKYTALEIRKSVV